MRELKTRALIIFVLIPLFILSGETCPAFDRQYEKAPAKLQAALIIKILAMSKEINTGDPISIHVLNAPEAATELKKAVGRKIGKSVLAEVRDSDEMPLDEPSALYIGKHDNLDVEAISNYCRENRILSITGNPGPVEQGVTLGFGITGDKLKILLNARASKAQKITWHPTLLKISRIFR